MPLRNSARPISIAVSIWGVSCLAGLGWSSFYRRRFDLCHPYLKEALQTVEVGVMPFCRFVLQKDETFNMVMGETPKLLKYRKGCVDSFGTRGRATVKMEGNGNRATVGWLSQVLDVWDFQVMVGGTFLEDPILRLAREEEYRDLEEYYKVSDDRNLPICSIVWRIRHTLLETSSGQVDDQKKTLEHIVRVCVPQNSRRFKNSDWYFYSIIHIFQLQ